MSRKSQESETISNLIIKCGLVYAIYIAVEKVIFAWNATPDKMEESSSFDVAVVFVLPFAFTIASYYS
jgi:uncharacterized membrane protein